MNHPLLLLSAPPAIRAAILSLILQFAIPRSLHPQWAGEFLALLSPSAFPITPFGYPATTYTWSYDLGLATSLFRRYVRLFRFGRLSAAQHSLRLLSLAPSNHPVSRNLHRDRSPRHCHSPRRQRIDPSLSCMSVLNHCYREGGETPSFPRGKPENHCLALPSSAGRSLPQRPPFSLKVVLRTSSPGCPSLGPVCYCGLPSVACLSRLKCTPLRSGLDSARCSKVCSKHTRSVSSHHFTYPIRPSSITRTTRETTYTPRLSTAIPPTPLRCTVRAATLRTALHRTRTAHVYPGVHDHRRGDHVLGSGTAGHGRLGGCYCLAIIGHRNKRHLHSQTPRNLHHSI